MRVGQVIGVAALVLLGIIAAVLGFRAAAHERAERKIKKYAFPIGACEHCKARVLYTPSWAMRTPRTREGKLNFRVHPMNHEPGCPGAVPNG